MVIFYTKDKGNILGGCAADSPDVVITKVPDGCEAVYLDDTQYAYVWSNMGEYSVQNGSIVHTPILDSVKLQNAQSAKLSELLESRDGAIIAGFASATSGHTYYFDPSSQSKFHGQAAMLALDSTITSVSWLTQDAGVVAHDRETFIGVLKDGAAHETAQHTKYFSLVSQVQSATSVDEVVAIVW